jgi:hypothetical protein
VKPNRSTYQTVLPFKRNFHRYSEEHDVDVLLLGTNGFTRNVLGSVSDRCASSARCTTIVVKDPRASLSKIQE